MDEPSSDTVRSVARVFNRILEEEEDSDHVSTVENALDRLWDISESVEDVDPSNTDEDDVEATFEFIEEFAPTRNEMTSYRANNNGDSHPDATFNYITDFVDRAERYVNGCLPSFRDWEVEYIRDGEVVEKRTYDHDDEIPTEPIINGVRHECERTKRGDSEVTVYVSEHPVRDDVDIVINSTGDDFINLESHNGPNISNPEEPIEVLSEEFNWGMLGDTEIILKEDPNDVLTFIEDNGWTFERK